MTDIYTVAVQKGGTGKTATAAMLAQAAAYRGMKALALDEVQCVSHKRIHITSRFI